jgi:xylulokinase
MSGDVTVGVDIGTTSVKALAVDGDGTVVARVRVPHGFIASRPDQLEHDAVRAWRRGPRKAWRDLGEHAASARGVCLSAMVPSLAPVDRRGVPIGPGVLYGDGRGANDSGLPDPLGQFPALVGWGAKEHPDARGYWPAQAVGAVALGGVPVVDSSTAGVAFPLFDGEGWDEAATTALGARVEQLPRVVTTGEAAGELRNGTVLASGVVDGLAEQMMAGADHAGDVLVLLGATLIVWVVGTEWKQVDGLMTLPHGDGLWACGGPSNAGGLFIEWVRRTFGDGPVTPATTADAVPIWLPYLRGERAPYHDPSRRAQLFDLHSGHDPAAVRRAAYEASGFVIRSLIDRSGNPPQRIVATGGGVRAQDWVQALADVTNLPVHAAAVPEGGALGAAFVARVAAGLESSLADAGRWSKTRLAAEPDPRVRGAADDRYSRFRAESG